MKPVKTATFRGTKYEIELDAPIDGRCEGTINTKNPKLSVFVDLDSVKGLETCIHEALHACCFAKTEEIVEQTAHDIAKFLRRLGFRYDGR